MDVFIIGIMNSSSLQILKARSFQYMISEYKERPIWLNGGSKFNNKKPPEEATAHLNFKETLPAICCC